MKPLVSIVLLNWNGDKHVHRCLEHVRKQTYPSIEVIVVDNGSSDESLSKIKANYPSYTYIENGTNRGFAPGMNQGIEASKGDFVIPLNQDVCMHERFVEECVSRAAEDERIGAIGGRVYRWIGNELTDILRSGEGELSVVRKRFQGDCGNYSEHEKWTWAPAGSFPFFRKKMLDDLRAVSGDYYDEMFVTGWEDTDLFFRMHLRGWKCLFFPKAFGWHVGSGSVGGNDKFFTKQLDYQVRILRNRYFVLAKDIPTPTLRFIAPYVLITEIGLIPMFLLRSPKSIVALTRAWKAVLDSWPELMHKRAKIIGSMSVPPTYLNQFFERF